MGAFRMYLNDATATRYLSAVDESGWFDGWPGGESLTVRDRLERSWPRDEIYLGLGSCSLPPTSTDYSEALEALTCPGFQPAEIEEDTVPGAKVMGGVYRSPNAGKKGDVVAVSFELGENIYCGAFSAEAVDDVLPFVNACLLHVGQNRRFFSLTKTKRVFALVTPKAWAKAQELGLFPPPGPQPKELELPIGSAVPRG